jgi:hypothetical protein
MTTTTIASIAQPDVATPVSFLLSPGDIFAACGYDNASETTADGSFIEASLSRVVWETHVENTRSGVTCRIAALAFNGPDFDPPMMEYVVEVGTPSGFFSMFWEEKAGDRAAIELMKQNAQKSYVAASVLCGVQVGYQLAAIPSRF